MLTGIKQNQNDMRPKDLTYLLEADCLRRMLLVCSVLICS